MDTTCDIQKPSYKVGSHEGEHKSCFYISIMDVLCGHDLILFIKIAQVDKIEDSEFIPRKSSHRPSGHNSRWKMTFFKILYIMSCRFSCTYVGSSFTEQENKFQFG